MKNFSNEGHLYELILGWESLNFTGERSKLLVFSCKTNWFFAVKTTFKDYKKRCSKTIKN